MRAKSALAWNSKKRVAARKAAETRRFRHGPWSREEWEAAAIRRIEHATGYEHRPCQWCKKLLACTCCWF